LGIQQKTQTVQIAKAIIREEKNIFANSGGEPMQ
jgi:hypothetical protein